MCKAWTVKPIIKERWAEEPRTTRRAFTKKQRTNSQLIHMALSSLQDKTKQSAQQKTSRWEKWSKCLHEGPDVKQVCNAHRARDQRTKASVLHMTHLHQRSTSKPSHVQIKCVYLRVCQIAWVMRKIAALHANMHAIVSGGGARLQKDRPLSWSVKHTWTWSLFTLCLYRSLISTTRA